MVHLADFVDVVAQTRDRRFFFGQDGLHLRPRPGEIVAIVVHRVVGILGGVKAATLAVTEPFIHPADDVAGHRGEEFRAGHLVGVDIILQQFGIVVAHLLEVRHDPVLVHRVAVKAAGELVIDAAAGHFLQSGDEDVAQLLVSRSAHIGQSEDRARRDGEIWARFRSRHSADQTS